MTKLTDLTAVTTPATGDFAYVADVSDTTDDAAGSSKKITLGNLKVGNVFDADYGAVTVSSGVWAIDGAPSGAFVGTTDTQTLTNKTLTTPTISTSLIFDGVTVTGLSGADVTILTGTAGTDGQLAAWNADGDVVGVTGATAGTITAKTTPVAADKLLISDSEDSNEFKLVTGANWLANYVAGATVTFTNKTLTNPKSNYTSFNAGTKSTGTYTPAYSDGNVQHCVNGGAFTLAPQSGAGTILIEMTNNGSAGTVTTSGYSIVTGDSLTTTDTHVFLLYSTVTNGQSHLNIVAMQ